MNAVYYCRVSTEEENQISALKSQIEEAQECIKNNNWNLIDGYVDEGKSGTMTNKRDEYIRLYNDLSTNKFDLIIIKSQDRLMRNVKDWSCSEYVRRGRKNKKDTRGQDKIIVTVKNSGCDNIHIKDEDINNILLEVAKTIFNKDRSKIINKLLFELKREFSKDNTSLQLENLGIERSKILNQKNLLLDKLLEGVITNIDYKRKDNEFEKRLQEISNKDEEIKINVNKYKDIESKVNEIRESLTSNLNDDVSKEKIIKHLETITIYKDTITIELDFFKPINVDYKKEGKKFQYVVSPKYLIPHTDKYRYDGEYREVQVKIAM